MVEKVDGQYLINWIEECARVIARNQDELSELDSSSGDADHGSNMARGFSAVSKAMTDETLTDPAAVLKQAGMTLVDTIGGSSGALYGTFFLRMARATGEAQSLNRSAFGAALRAGGEGIAERGSVKIGDKTMYDALAPAIEAYDNKILAGNDMGTALRAAADAAANGRDATATMVARRGRSSYVGNRSMGYVDPGAASMAMLIQAAADIFDSGGLQETGHRESSTRGT